MNEVIKVKGLSHSYIDGKKRREILKDCSIAFEEAKFHCILGESGSGKTTFLHLLAGLEKTESGEIYFRDKEINTIGLSKYRRKYVSIIFQDYNLIGYLNGYDNIVAAAMVSGVNVNREKIFEIAAILGLSKELLFKNVNQLSGGEKQRVAIAQSLITDSDVILADEPTGNLDINTSQNIIELFQKLVVEFHKTLIVVSHSKELANSADEIYIFDQKQKRIVRYEN